jgi:hypothetical protein
MLDRPSTEIWQSVNSPIFLLIVRGMLSKKECCCCVIGTEGEYKIEAREGGQSRDKGQGTGTREETELEQ